MVQAVSPEGRAGPLLVRAPPAGRVLHSGSRPGLCDNISLEGWQSYNSEAAGSLPLCSTL